MSSGHWPTSYLNKAKRCLQEHGQVQLSALGTAISAMVTGGRPNRQAALKLLSRGAWPATLTSFCMTSTIAALPECRQLA